MEHHEPLLLELSTQITAASNLGLVEKKAALVSLFRNGSQSKVDARLRAAEALFDEGKLPRPDFFLIIRIAASIQFAWHILRTREEIYLLLAAVEIFRSSWDKNPEIVLSACGGVKALVENLDVLPYSIVQKFLSILGAKCREDEHASKRRKVIDAIICQFIPTLDESGQLDNSLQRLAPLVVQRLLQAASASLVRRFMAKYPTMLTSEQRDKLAERLPEIKKLILLDRISPSSHLLSMDAMQSTDGDWFETTLSLALGTEYQAVSKGLHLMRKALISYSKNAGNLSIDLVDMIVNKRSSLLGVLEEKGLAEKLIEYYEGRKDAVQNISEIFSTLKGLRVLAKRWGWSNVYPFIKSAVKEFAGQKEQWSLYKPEDWKLSENNTISSFIHSLFGNLLEIELNPEKELLLTILPLLPTEGRLGFLARAYFACKGIDILAEPVNPKTVIDCEVIFMLGRYNGEKLLLPLSWTTEGIACVVGPGRFAYVNRPPSYYNPFAKSVNALLRLSSTSPDATSVRVKRAAFYAGWIDRDFSSARYGTTTILPANSKLEYVLETISILKTEAGRSSQPEDRMRLLKTVLVLTVLTHDIDLVAENLGWIAKRFCRDLEVGVALCRFVLHEVDSEAFTRLLGTWRKPNLDDKNQDQYLSEMQKHFFRINTILDALIGFIKLILEQPGNEKYQESLWVSYMSFIGSVVVKRFHFIKSICTFVEPNGLREAVLADLSPRILSLYTDEGITSSSKSRIQTNITVDTPSMMFVIIPWLEGLGTKLRDKYFEASGAKADRALQDALKEPKVFWPVNVSFSDIDTGNRGALTFDLQGTQYMALLEKLVFRPRKDFYEKGLGTRYIRGYFGHHRSGFPENVETYLSYSSSSEEAKDKLRRLFLYYAPVKDGEGILRDDCTFILLSIPLVDSMVLKMPDVLSTLFERYLPSYPDSANRVQMQVVPIFDQQSFLKVVDPNSDLMAEMCSAAEVGYSNLLDLLRHTKAIWDSGNSLSETDTVSRVIVLTVAWLCTLMELPVQYHVESQNAVAYAINNVRIDCGIKQSDTSAITWNRCRRQFDNVILLLSKVSSFLKSSEIHFLIQKIIAHPMTAKSRLVNLKLSKALRTNFPDDTKELAFHIIRDMDSSAWHRHALTKDLLVNVPPSKIKMMVNQFYEILKAVATTPKPVKDDRPPTELEKSLYLKVSTIKLFISYLPIAYELGLPLPDALQLSHNITQLSTNTSVTEEFIYFATQILRLENQWSLSDSSKENSMIWSKLQSFSEVASQLSEDEQVLTKDWEYIQQGKKPLPTVSNTPHIATSLLGITPESLPRDIRRKWIEKILVPTFIQHVKNRTLWLRALARSFGWPSETIDTLYASYMQPFDAPRILGQWMIIQEVSIETFESILFLIEQRLSFRERHGAIQQLKAANGTDDVLLSSFNQIDPNFGDPLGQHWKNALETLVKFVLESEANQFGLPLVAHLLENVGKYLLAPESMSNSSIKPEGNTRAPSFYMFTEYCKILLPHTQLHSPSIVGQKRWNQFLRPLLEKFLAMANSFEKRELTVSEGGSAVYWPTIIMLKALLLHHPSSLSPQSSTPEALLYGAEIAQLCREIITYPSYRLLLRYLATLLTTSLQPLRVNILNICRSLTSQPAGTKEEIESLTVCFELAFTLLSQAGLGSDSAGDEATDLIKEWQAHDKPLIRWMVLDIFPIIKDEFDVTRVSQEEWRRGRGRGRGRGGRGY
ncbi:hypothetical protein M422DRAFT_776819 [Sphaerobolus stellatus SS14]|nr:hypothetical protein M422DRAFT_776819 [Sphaerobolus stellatus SS14]